MTTRDDILEALQTSLCEIDLFRSAWLGGSDAMGRADSLSDIDLVCFIPAGGAEDGFGHIERVLGDLALIEDQWRLPSPTWHGGEQTFYQLRGCPDYGLLDVVLTTHAPGFEFFVKERHGTPVVLFDHDGLIEPTTLDRAAHDKRRRQRVEVARGKFALLSHLAGKEARRGRPIDALQFYMELVVHPLVDVLRGVHCPDRFDYNLRYLRDDLPALVCDEFERLVYPSSHEQIAGCTQRASVMMREALRQWDAHEADSARTDRAGPLARDPLSDRQRSRRCQAE